jgi:cob(I)alamin adenosyltransferase
MSISTKTGDKGETGLWSGQRIPKDDIRVESYGTVDELNSFLGDAKHYTKHNEVVDIIEEIQRNLFKVGGQLATVDKLYLEPVSENDVERLTSLVHHYESIVPLTGFVIPGSTKQSAKLDICRTIARRAERLIIKLSKIEKIDEVIIRYMNRLSDLFYMMARFEEKQAGKIRFKKEN